MALGHESGPSASPELLQGRLPGLDQSLQIHKAARQTLQMRGKCRKVTQKHASPVGPRAPHLLKAQECLFCQAASEGRQPPTQKCLNASGLSQASPQEAGLCQASSPAAATAWSARALLRA